jgi:hypothetical protein
MAARSSRVLLETNESRYFLPDQEWLIPSSIGYREAMAGIVWVRLLTYFGEQHEVRGNFGHLRQYLIAVTSLDPYFYRAYTWGSVAAIYNGTVIDRPAVEFSIEMLQRGLRRFPNDGDLHYYLGFQYYFELHQLVEGAEREQVRQIGLDELCTAAILGGGPPYLPLLCSSIAERQGMDHIAEERLSQALLEAQDDWARTRIETRLEELMTPDAAYAIIRRIADFRLRWEREMPYAPIGLYVLTGTRPLVPQDNDVTLPLPMDEMLAAELEEVYLRLGDEDMESEEPEDDMPDLETDSGAPADEVSRPEGTGVPLSRTTTP